MSQCSLSLRESYVLPWSEKRGTVGRRLQARLSSTVGLGLRPYNSAASLSCSMMSVHRTEETPRRYTADNYVIMRVYRGQKLLDDEADFAQFQTLLATAVAERWEEPLLLVRDDDMRLLVVISEGNIMLCMARAANECLVSYQSSYSEATRAFRGLANECWAKDENFVEPLFAIKAIDAFFSGKRLSDHVDFCRGAPDSEITSFPTAIGKPEPVERNSVQMRVDVPAELRADMQAVCEFLDEVAHDADENIDFDDAIQIGALCGGRLDRRREIYIFSYYLANGDNWSFRSPRTVLDGIADGSICRIDVTAWVEKRAKS